MVRIYSKRTRLSNLNSGIISRRDSSQNAPVEALAATDRVRAAERHDLLVGQAWGFSILREREYGARPVSRRRDDLERERALQKRIRARVPRTASWADSSSDAEGRPMR